VWRAENHHFGKRRYGVNWKESRKRVASSESTCSGVPVTIT
jgi:hypothetical protein